METGRSVFLGQFFFLFVPRNSRRSARVEENARRGNSQNFKYFLRVTRGEGESMEESGTAERPSHIFPPNDRDRRRT